MVELNEFNPSLLQSAVERLGLEHIAEVLTWPHSRTTTADRVEHHGLDPWVQWVGIHSGVPTAVHEVRRLGETRNQTRPQIWARVAALGNSWGAWGVMNAPQGDAPRCTFFMPDPWSYEEHATPAELNDLLALPRYAAQNYLDLRAGRLVGGTLRLIGRLSRPGYWATLPRFATASLRSLLRTRGTIHTFTTLLDYLSTLVFVKLRREKRPDFSVIFLNHIAHLQHHFWIAGERFDPEMEVGLRLCDAMLGAVLADRQPGEAMIVTNGLKQINVAGRGFCVYRQRSPERVLAALGITGARVEQGMTHDAHLLFQSADDADAARRVIEGCVLSDGTKPFFVEPTSATALFYQIDFEHRVANGVTLNTGGETVPFDDLFELVAERTGAHIPEGDVYADGVGIPPELLNHELYDVIVDYFSPRAAIGPIDGTAMRVAEGASSP
jgi:hypothetical protein